MDVLSLQAIDSPRMAGQIVEQGCRAESSTSFSVALPD